MPVLHEGHDFLIFSLNSAIKTSFSKKVHSPFWGLYQEFSESMHLGCPSEKCVFLAAKIQCIIHKLKPEAEWEFCACTTATLPRGDAGVPVNHWVHFSAISMFSAMPVFNALGINTFSLWRWEMSLTPISLGFVQSCTNQCLEICH